MHQCVWGVLPDTVLSWAEQTKIALKTKVLGYFFYFTFSVIVAFVSRMSFENHIREKTHKQRVRVKALRIGFSSYRAGGCTEKLHEEGRRGMSGHSDNMM